MSRVKPIFLVVAFVVISLVFGSYIKGSVVDFTGNILNSYFKFTGFIKDTINEHFRQIEEIRSLREQNKELQKSAILLSTFANELDQILVDKNSSRYNPQVTLIRTLSYSKISDYNKFWVDFKDFNTSKVYGAIFEGKTAGIVVSYNNKPLAILQKDPKSSFSVYVGKSRIPGIANGNSKDLIIKFMPQWLNPKVGDEIYTSGLDDIFFAGVPVGKVKEVIDEDLYKSAVVEPYADPNIPAFLYVVTKEY